jgi:phospho-N-acetylmuramoyl-pentapeptide-transferase
MRAILLGGGFGLLLSLLGTRVAISQFTRLGYGQEIREDGPTTHHTKRGTPTMGGVAIIGATVLGYVGAKLVTWTAPSASALLLLFLFAGMGLVGFLDDFIKISNRRNLGLRSRAKMIGQTVIAVVFGALALSPWLEDEGGRTPASEKISFLRDIDWLALPAFLAVLLIWLIVVGTSNGVNLADGLDGLATGSCAMVFGAYTIVNIWQYNQFCQRDGSGVLSTGSLQGCYDVRDPYDLAIIAAALTGACFGFLWWNASPARIFMGDTGSLALGGALAGFAILTRTELLLLVLGGLFVMITLSVMIQVSVFKASRKSALFRRVFRVPPQHRVFRMAPLQHHFEQLGWEQVTIVIRFWIITGLFVATGLGIFYAEWVARA